MALTRINNQALPTVDSGKLPSGTVLQVVQSTSTTQKIIESTSFVDSGLSATITPTSTSNKILVIASQIVTNYQTGNAAITKYLNLVRDSTEIMEKAGTSAGAASSTNYFYGVIDGNFTCLDSPNTTSAVTYKTQGRSSSTANNHDLVFNDTAGSSSTMVLMEIAG